jgi:hypothetical protein
MRAPVHNDGEIEAVFERLAGAVVRAGPRKQAAARLRTQWRFSAPLVAEERSPVGLRTGVLAARPRRPEIPEHRDELPSCPC